MGKELNETQIKAMLQLAILYDVQDSVDKVTDIPRPHRTRPIADWLKNEHPDLHKKFGLDELLSFGNKMKSPTFSPEAFRKVGMDSLPLNTIGKFGIPTLYPEAYAEAGLSDLKTDSLGKISPIGFQNDLLERLGIEESALNPKTRTLREKFQGPEAPHQLSLQEKFQAPEASHQPSIRERFQVPGSTP